jgi:protein arginine N-methyltransferase 1
MVTDGSRLAYQRALHSVVEPDSIVADIGAGTGIMSMMACSVGAAHVYAVEPDDVIEIARSMAAANGFADRISFIQGVSSAVELPRPADVIVSDLRSMLPLYERHIPSIIDARERLLAPGGRLIPRADNIWAALVHDAELYVSYEEPWLRNDYGLDMSAGHDVAVNMWRKALLRPEQVLVPPKLWASLDYETIDDPDVGASMTWTVEQVGSTHGLAVWFDAELDEENRFSNAPGRPELVYGQAFFPWTRPVSIEPGDVVTVDLRADLVGDDYVWSWAIDHRPVEGSDRPSVTHRQSTFRGAPMPPSMLRRRKAGHRPVLGIDGKADRYLLAAMDGDTTLEVIACQAAAEFPDHFPTWKDSLARASELAAKYGS